MGFEDRDTLGDYMTVLQRGNQVLFADQKKLLEKIKKIKKEAANPAAKVDAEPPVPAPAAAVLEVLSLYNISVSIILHRAAALLSTLLVLMGYWNSKSAHWPRI